jgi:hypothetical protein
MEAMRVNWTDDRLDNLSGRMDERFDHIDERFDGGFGEVNRRLDAMEAKIDALGGRLDTFLLGLLCVGGGLTASLVTAVVALIVT